MRQHDAVISFGTKKALRCWRAYEYDMQLFMDEAADERITVGGVFTIDGKCSTMHGEKSPVRD